MLSANINMWPWLLGVMFIALAINASAQWSPGGAMVYMGDLNLAASSASSEKAVQALGALRNSGSNE